MKSSHRSLWLAVSFALCAAPCADPAAARQTVVTGTAGVGYDFRDRSYEKEDVADVDEGDAQKMSIGPTIVVTSKGIYDTLNFSYAPQFSYDSVDETSEIDQQLHLSNDRSLTKHWSLSLANDFVYSDDPGLTSDYFTTSSTTSASGGQTGSQAGSGNSALSRDASGRQYWTNTASLSTSYQMFESTQIGGGYSFTVLRNEDDDDVSTSEDYDEYDKHTFFTNLSHAFNPNWRSTVGLSYTRGLYDDEESTIPASTSNFTPDLDEYGADLGLEYIQSASDSFPLQYSFSQTAYDGDTRRDTEAHEWSAGWRHAFDAQTSFSVGGGPSYVKTEGLEGDWGYNGYITYDKKYEHAALSLRLDKRYDTQNFDGTDESGLTDTYNATARFTYQYTQSLGFNAFARYTWESQIDPQGDYRTAASGSPLEETTGDLTYDKDIYEAGVGLQYTFARWYTAGLKYIYYVSDGQLDEDQYTDHQVLVTLSATQELWRW